jgi:WD40 repeat protein
LTQQHLCTHCYAGLGRLRSCCQLPAAHRPGQWRTHTSHAAVLRNHVPIECCTVLCTVSAPAGYEGYQCARFHPDGALVGAGTSDGRVHLWDVSTHSSAPSLELVHHSTLSEVASVAFSSSGVHCAAGSTDGSATLWDLRKSAAPVMVYGERQSDPCECFVVQVPFATTSNGCYREL